MPTCMCPVINEPRFSQVCFCQLIHQTFSFAIRSWVLTHNLCKGLIYRFTQNHSYKAGSSFVVQNHGYVIGPSFVLQNHGYNIGPSFVVQNHGYVIGPSFVVQNHGYNIGPSFGIQNHGYNIGPSFGIQNHGYVIGPSFVLQNHGYNIGLSFCPTEPWLSHFVVENHVTSLIWSYRTTITSCAGHLS